MGNFVNPGNDAFRVALASSIYVDKTGLLEYTNKVTGTLQAYICNSRPEKIWQVNYSQYADGLL